MADHITTSEEVDADHIATSEEVKADHIATFEDVKAVVEARDRTVLIIDVRKPAELEETGTYPGSINIPVGELENILKNVSANEFKSRYGQEKPDFEDSIIFSCKGGRRGNTATELALELGYKNAKNYKGAYSEWERKMKEW